MERLPRWLPLLLALGVYAGLHARSLTAPPVGRDAWRETDVLTVSRNFCREHAPIWLPRIDARGEGSGITGMEFPAIDWTIGKLECAGFDPVKAGRALVFVFALLAIGCLYWLLYEAGGTPPHPDPALRGEAQLRAILAAAVFAFSPLLFYYGRSVQPDVPAVALALLSLVLFERATRSGQLRAVPLFGAAGAIALAALIKLPAIVYGLPMLVLLISRRPARACAREWRLWAFAAIALVPAFLWYRYARALQDRYGIHYFYLGSDLPSLVRAWTSWRFYDRIFLQQLFDVYAFPLASAAALWGLFLARTPAWVRAMAIGAVTYFFLAGFQASHHFYYGVIATPAVAAPAGIALGALFAKLRRPGLVAAAAVAVIAAYGVGRTARWVAPEDALGPFEAAKAELARVEPQDARALVFSRGDPKLLWLLDRKGWVGAADGVPARLVESAPRAPIVALDGQRLSTEVRRGFAEALAQLGYRRIVAFSAVEVWVGGVGARSGALR